MSCNEKVLKLNHWKVELDSTRHTHTHTYRVSIRHRRAPGLLNLVEFNLTKAEQVSLTDRHNFTYNWNCGTFKSVSSVCPPSVKVHLSRVPRSITIMLRTSIQCGCPRPTWFRPDWSYWHFTSFGTLCGGLVLSADDNHRLKRSRAQWAQPRLRISYWTLYRYAYTYNFRCGLGSRLDYNWIE